MTNETTGWVSGALKWAQQSIKETPGVGYAYDLFNENISAPLWKYGSITKDYATTYFSSACKWTHQSIKEIPGIGRVYNLFNDNITAPLWKNGCLVKGYATPYFKNFAFLNPRQHPIIATVVLGSMAVVVGRAIYKYQHSKENP